MPQRFRIVAWGLTGRPTVAGAPAAGVERLVVVGEGSEGPEEIRFGRRPGVDVELPHPEVAPVHARLLRSGEAWVLEDMGSDAGTWVDGQRLTPGTPQTVAPGQVLRIGPVQVRWEGAGRREPSAEGTATLARRLVADLFGVSDAALPTLQLLVGADAGEVVLRLRDRDRVYTAGREDACDLVLPLDDVSREHAGFVRRADGCFVRDLGSKNGVRVGETLVVGEAQLQDGEVVQIGSAYLRFEDPEERYLRALQTGTPAAALAALPAADGSVAAPTRPNATRSLPLPRKRRPKKRRSLASPALLTGVAIAVLVGVVVAALALALGAS